MWCLRYWAIVPLLPFPTAPPLFQLLWLVSMLASSRPCAYCSVLLVCLFLSTCHFNQSLDDLTTACRCFISFNGGKLFSSLPSLGSSPSPSPASSRLAALVSNTSSSLNGSTNGTAVNGGAGGPGTSLLTRWLRDPPSWTLPVGGERGLRISLGL